MGKYSVAMMMMSFLMLCLWLLAAAATEAEYPKYKDPKQPLNMRIKDLMRRMSLEEKIGQMTQIERTLASPRIVKKYFVGSVISAGGSPPPPKASAEDWVNMVNDLQRGALSTRLGIPMIYGIDAIHGHNFVYKATVFPHNVGLGVTRQRQITLIQVDSFKVWLSFEIKPLVSFTFTNQIEFLVRYLWTKMLNRDPVLVKRIGAATALEVRATGIPYTFAPSISVCRDPRWGRCYESYSEDHKIVRTMTEIIPGLQGDIPSHLRKGVPFVAGKTKVAACAKHFVGDGGTVKGIDENNTLIDFHGLLSIHMTPYFDSIIKGVSTVMIAYSSLNGKKMHANHELVTGFLKNKLKFRGFVISDWKGIDRITDPPRANYSYSVQAGVLAGLDMGIGKGSSEEILVLLKNGKSANQPLVPLSKKVGKVLVAGTHADNLGYQCGGWTVEWQGVQGNDRIVGTTILKAIRNTVHPSTHVVHMENPDTDLLRSHEFSYAIVVVGEVPYAEMYGDSENLSIIEPGPSTIMNVCGIIRCVVIVISGRPVVIEPHLAQIDALVAAWLPGTEGQGVADVLFGHHGFTGKLARTWFRTVDQLPMNIGDPHYDPLFPFGFGLTTKPRQENSEV
ncbi:UNVERIFIED_CONTAM: Lysosomal beta glucosidase [Sesamum radiatum]|uniref:beta-glucosidase n=1 Tax=Sesamum radiatum TaxID=300843 RepID=A0AAW2UNG1_SESRA